MLLYDAFRLFDTNRNGLITAPELWGALEWLGVEATANDILDFMRTADKNQDGYDVLIKRRFVQFGDYFKQVFFG